MRKKKRIRRGKKRQKKGKELKEEVERAGKVKIPFLKLPSTKILPSRHKLLELWEHRPSGARYEMKT